MSILSFAPDDDGVRIDVAGENLKFYGSASNSVAALIERGSLHRLTLCRASQDGPPVAAYEL
jgi:hypothetical protein